MEPTVLAGMLFVLIILAMIGGFILLFPITRRLGAILEERIGDKSSGAREKGELRQLQASVQMLQSRLEEVAARQEFAEGLLAERHDRRLPAVEEKPS